VLQAGRCTQGWAESNEPSLHTPSRAEASRCQATPSQFDCLGTLHSSPRTGEWSDPGAYLRPRFTRPKQFTDPLLGRPELLPVH
jgi:hypothetical protein